MEPPVKQVKQAAFDKAQVDKIVALHEANREKDEAVKELKSEMQTFQTTTAEQLQTLIQQIASLQERVQTEVHRKEDEISQWEQISKVSKAPAE